MVLFSCIYLYSYYYMQWDMFNPSYKYVQKLLHMMKNNQDRLRHIWHHRTVKDQGAISSKYEGKQHNFKCYSQLSVEPWVRASGRCLQAFKGKRRGALHASCEAMIFMTLSNTILKHTGISLVFTTYLEYLTFQNYSYKSHSSSYFPCHCFSTSRMDRSNHIPPYSTD